AALAGGRLHAALVGLRRGCRNVVARLARMVWIADVDRAHAGVEPGDENVLPRVHRRLVLVGGMRAEAPAAAAEAALRVGMVLGHVEGSDAHRHLLVGDVGDEHHLARLLAFVGELLVDDEREVAAVGALVLRELGEVQAEHRQRGVHAVVDGEVHAPDLRGEQVRRGRLVRPGEELRPVDDLQHAGLVRAVGEVDAVALDAGGDRSVQVGRHVAARAGLLPDEAEVADQHGVRRIGKVEHLGHATRAPALDSGHEVADPGVALPPALVRVPQLVDDHRDARGLLRVGHVPDLVRQLAHAAKQVDLRLVRLRQIGAVARAHHLRPAGFPLARLAGNVREIARRARVRDVHDRGAVVLLASGERVRGLAAVVSDVGDKAPALPVNDRLVGAAALQLVVAEERHVRRARSVLRDCRAGEDSQRKKRKQSHQCPLLEVGASYRTPLSGTLFAVKRALARPGEIAFFHSFRRFEMNLRKLMPLAVAAAFAVPFAAPVSAAGDSVILAQSSSSGGDAGAPPSGASGMGTSPRTTGGAPSAGSTGEPKAPTADRSPSSGSTTSKRSGRGGADFSAIDKNGDGMISRDEWDAYRAGRAASGGSTAAPAAPAGATAAPAARGKTGTTAGPGEASPRTAPSSDTATSGSSSGTGKAQ